MQKPTPDQDTTPGIDSLTETMNRRELLRRGAGLVAATTLAANATDAAPAPTGDGFTFLLYTDIHVEPELHATQGFHKAVETMKATAPEAQFALCGGDLVYDANAVPLERAASLFDTYKQQSALLGIPTYHALGNHDIFGLDLVKSGAKQTDLEWGKALFQQKTGQKELYYSFDHGGWHFIVLDTVQITQGPALTTGNVVEIPDPSWRGYIDDAQMAWLAGDLKKTGQTPTIILAHMPILCAYEQYAKGTTEATPDKLIVANGKAVKELIQPYNVKAVLQGHTHVVEEISYLGTRYVSCGAVCGDWWKGWRLGVHPEGFVVCHARPNGDFTYRYVPYGWVADKPPVA
jgi:Icc protein